MTNHIDNLVQLHEQLEIVYHVDHYAAQLSDARRQPRPLAHIAGSNSKCR